ncbi:MAG: helix-turn-helix transcriptional regulator [Tepidisphaeraceae bacterium]
MSTSPTPLEYALLGLLRTNPQSGYDLRKTFSSTPMRHYSDSPGSIYPALRRMEAKAWIAGSAEGASARKRQVFRVTGSGEHALGEWLRRPVTRDDLIWRLDQLMLRFAFLDGNVPRQVTMEFLAAMERELESYVRELRAFARDSGRTGSVDTGTLAFGFGIESYQANLDWARRARQQLKGRRT